MKGIAPYRFVLYGVFLLVAIVYAGNTFLADRSLPEGSKVPPVKLTLTDGDVLDLRSAPGRVIVLSFWASWCEPCRREAPMLNALSEQVLVVGISLDDADPQAAQRLGRGLGMEFPIAARQPGLARTFSVEVLPTVYVVAPDGVITFAHTGLVSRSSLTRAIEEAGSRRI